MLPSAPTDLTMPMCSSQTIRSPGCGCAPAAGVARPLRSAQAHTSSTRPKPWPWSPSGVPAPRAAQETKYAHHGPTPEPAVAWRYWAIRGESLEPGGCSATPTSWRARLTIAWPAGVPPDAGSGVAPVAPVAWPIRLAKDVLAPAPASGVLTAVAAGAAAALGASNSELSCATRAMTAANDIAHLRHPEDRPLGDCPPH